LRLRLAFTAIALGAGLLLAPAQAKADTISFDWVGHASVVTVAGPNGGSPYDVWAGELKWDWVGATPAGLSNPVYTYCVDIVTDLTSPQDVSITSTSNLTSSVATLAPEAAAKAAWLVNSFADTVRSTADGWYANVLGAALQVAIWEALYDSTNDLAGGAFQLVTTGTIATQAQAYLTALYASDYTGSTAVLLDTRDGQDQITKVPEPGTLLLLGTGIAAFYTRSRRPAVALPVA